MIERLINVYLDDEVNEPHYVIVSTKMKWEILEHKIDTYDCDDFLEMVSNYIDEKEYEKAVMIKKHKSEIKFLKDEIAELQSKLGECKK